MTELNPYSTPEADLTTEQDARYEPKFLSTKGRIGRLRFFAYNFAVQLVMLPFFGIVGFFTTPGPEVIGAMSSSLMVGMGFLYVVLIAFSIILGRRRIHDLNRSSWWLLLMIVPLLNFFLGVYLMVFKGTQGANNYGLAPISNSTGVKAMGMILPALFIIGIMAAVGIPAYQEYQARVEQAG